MKSNEDSEFLTAELSWDDYFMGIAELSSKRSKDPKTRVGAVIINPENKNILSIGYNGFPRNFPDYREFWESDEKHKFVVHAEANAILNSNANLSGAVLYTTMFPCNECAKLIAQKGIKKIIYLDDKFEKKESGKASKYIFEYSSIIYEKYEKGE